MIAGNATIASQYAGLQDKVEAYLQPRTLFELPVKTVNVNVIVVCKKGKLLD